MTAIKINSEQIRSSVDSNSVLFNAASNFTIDLSKYTNATHITIHVKNSGALTALVGTMALTCGLQSATVTLPASPVTVAGSLPNPATVTSYDQLIVIKGGFFTKLQLAYTATSGSGSLIVEIATSYI